MSADPRMDHSAHRCGSIIIQAPAKIATHAQKYTSNQIALVDQNAPTPMTSGSDAPKISLTYPYHSAIDSAVQITTEMKNTRGRGKYETNISFCPCSGEWICKPLYRTQHLGRSA